MVYKYETITTYQIISATSKINTDKNYNIYYESGRLIALQL